MVWMAALASFLLLMAIGRWRGTPAGLALAFYIALGIGIHNFGEGLAIGAAFAAGSAGLGTFLVLGFALHNVTEGIGIAAPMLKIRPPLWAFATLTLLAGGPAILGMWMGSLAYAPQWTALALAIGAGAILQVIVEVTSYLMRQNPDRQAALFSPAVLSGFLGHRLHVCDGGDHQDLRSRRLASMTRRAGKNTRCRDLQLDRPEGLDTHRMEQGSGSCG